MFVDDYMTVDPVTIRDDAPLIDAERLMHHHGFRQLPVLDEAGRLCGIITDRDQRKIAGLGEPLRKDLTVAEVMSAEPLTVSASATLDEAVRLLINYKFGSLPVLRGKQLVGVLTYIDALRALADVLGLDEPEKHIEVALPNGVSDAARALSALNGCSGAVMTAFVSKGRREGGEPSLYLRIKDEHAARVTHCLREIGMVLLDSEKA